MFSVFPMDCWVESRILILAIIETSSHGQEHPRKMQGNYLVGEKGLYFLFRHAQDFCAKYTPPPFLSYSGK